MDQMANLLIERQPGSLPSNSEVNPRREGNEHVKAVMLRSGKELVIQEQPSVTKEVETEKSSSQVRMIIQRGNNPKRNSLWETKLKQRIAHNQ